MWLYKGEQITQIEDLPNYNYLEGFVYMITCKIDGKIYIGKKTLFFSKKTKISAREKKETKTRKKSKIVIKESDWLSYWGSSVELHEDIKKYGEQNFEREILELCCSKKYLTYCEVKYQIQFDVLNRNTYNSNIFGKFFIRDMQNCK